MDQRQADLKFLLLSAPRLEKVELCPRVPDQGLVHPGSGEDQLHEVPSDAEGPIPMPGDQGKSGQETTVKIGVG